MLTALNTDHMPTRLIRYLVALLVAAPAVAQQQQVVPAASPEEPAAVVGRVSARLARGGRVAVDNFTTGRIRVVGWDRETVEATATSERGSEAVKIRLEDTDKGRVIYLDVAFSDEGEFRALGPTRLPSPPLLSDDARTAKPAPPAEQAPEMKKAPPDDGAVKSAGGVFVRKPQIDIEVRVPRYVFLDPIRVFRSPVEVTGIETPVIVIGDRSEIALRDVGGASVQTRSGRVRVEGARADVDVLTVSGAVHVSGVGGSVRARTLSGAVEVSCVRGNVDAGTAVGPVTLAGVGGDVSANTSGGDLRLVGAVREGGTYRLKSMDGRVEMGIAAPARGFSFSLSSYSGTVESDLSRETAIDVQVQEDTTNAETNRRRTGRHGDGRAQISLDSFQGPVRLTRATAVPPCR